MGDERNVARRTQGSLTPKVKVKMKSLSLIRLFATPWTVAYHTPESMGFSGQEYWSGLPFPSSEDLPNSGIKPTAPALPSRFFTTGHQGSHFKYRII